MTAPTASLTKPFTLSRWRVHYGDAYFLVWAPGERDARRNVERFGYQVTAVERDPAAPGH